MYINPVLVGVLGTLFVELALLTGVAMVKTAKDSDKGENDNA